MQNDQSGSGGKSSSEKGKVLRILHLEDVQGDADLIRDVLQRELSCEITHVSTPREFEPTLRSENFDVVLCDHGVPGYSGLRALTYAKSLRPFTPVIIISGILDDADAVASLKCGATDYVLKQKLVRLAPSIRRAIQEAADKQARETNEGRIREQNDQLRQRSAELSAANSQLNELLENSPAILYALKLENGGPIPCAVSENISAFLGFTVEEALHPDWWQNHLHPEDREFARKKGVETLETGATRSEYRVRHKNGSYYWVEDKQRVVREADGRPVTVVGVWTDTTERHRAEDVLHSVSSEAAGSRKRKVFLELAAVAALAAIAFALGRRHNIFLPLFAGLASQGKHPLGDALAAGLIFLVAGLAVFSFRRWKESLAEADAHRHITKSLRILHDELDRRVQQRTVELAKSNGALQVQIGEREKAQAALKESERRFREMLGNIDLVSVMLDDHARITYCNDHLLRLTGWQRDGLLGRDWFEIFIPPEINPGVNEVYHDLLDDKPKAWHHENEILTRDGKRRLIRWNNSVLRSPAGSVIGTASIGEDITDRKQSERMALRSQRLEAIGTLAGGVAHDLNNALAPIMMGAEMLRSQHPEESEIIDMFYNSARRGADMVRQLLTFAKGAEGERVLIQPGHLVKEIRNLMQGSFPKNIRIKQALGSDLPMVLGDATQLHQVLLNLCVNARDAMADGGSITLEARAISVDATYAGTIADARPGRYVLLRVIDSGTGIPAEILDRIFDPFFTTKGPDKGTGLGLSTVMGIVKGHGGFIHVYSQCGKGTTFGVYLPVAASEERPEVSNVSHLEFHGNGETILFVDDDQAVRGIARAVLRRLNLTPVTASDANEALMVAIQRRNDLRAIITDLHMPGADGRAFVRSVRSLLPHTAIAVCSGKMDESDLEELRELNVKAILNKPFTELELTVALRSLLQPDHQSN